MPNFTLQDLLGSLLAVAIFPLIYVAPGYVIGWALDLFDFRWRLLATRFVIAVAVSVAVSPILTFLTYHFGLFGFAVATLIIFAMAFVAILLGEKRLATPEAVKAHSRRALLLVGGWVALSLLLLVDLQIGNRLYFNRVGYDFTTRVTIINAISRSGVPPINGSFYPGHPIRMTYVYYFWYIPCSIVEQLGGPLVDARAAMIGSVAWCGIALMSIVALYLRQRNADTGERAWQNGLLGAGLLVVSGLDVLAAILQFGVLIPFHGDLEQWNEQIIAWLGGLLWVPHHIAALIACLVALLLAQWMRQQQGWRRIGPTLVAGLAFASAIGLSVFVTLVFVVFWAIWWALLLRRKERQAALLMAAAGILAVVFASPFLLGLLQGSNGGTGAGGLPLTFAVRIFRPIIPFVGSYPPRLLDVIFLLVLPINYLMELGFFFLAALFWVIEQRQGRWKQNPYYVAEVILLGVVACISSFLRSTVIASNDFGWRSWLPGQFVVLVWGTDIIHHFFPQGLRATVFGTLQARRIGLELRVLLAIGVLTTAVDLLLLRTWPLLEDAGVPSYFTRECMDLQQGERTFAARQAYDYINASTPRDTVVQLDPADLLNIPIGLYLDRQMAVSGHTAYGVSVDDMLQHARSVLKIFKDETSWPEIDASCRANSIDMIVVNDLDPLWVRTPALEAQRPALYQNAYYAVFPCGAYSDP